MDDIADMNSAEIQDIIDILASFGGNQYIHEIALLEHLNEYGCICLPSSAI